MAKIRMVVTMLRNFYEFQKGWLDWLYRPGRPTEEVFREQVESAVNLNGLRKTLEKTVADYISSILKQQGVSKKQQQPGAHAGGQQQQTTIKLNDKQRWELSVMLANAIAHHLLNIAQTPPLPGRERIIDPGRLAMRIKTSYFDLDTAKRRDVVEPKLKEIVSNYTQDDIEKSEIPYVSSLIAEDAVRFLEEITRETVEVKETGRGKSVKELLDELLGFLNSISGGKGRIYKAQVSPQVTLRDIQQAVAELQRAHAEGDAQRILQSLTNLENLILQAHDAGDAMVRRAWAGLAERTLALGNRIREELGMRGTNTALENKLRQVQGRISPQSPQPSQPQPSQPQPPQSPPTQPTTQPQQPQQQLQHPPQLTPQTQPPPAGEEVTLGLPSDWYMAIPYLAQVREDAKRKSESFDVLVQKITNLFTDIYNLFLSAADLISSLEYEEERRRLSEVIGDAFGEVWNVMNTPPHHAAGEMGELRKQLWEEARRLWDKTKSEWGKRLEAVRTASAEMVGESLRRIRERGKPLPAGQQYRIYESLLEAKEKFRELTKKVGAILAHRSLSELSVALKDSKGLQRRGEEIKIDVLEILETLRWAHAFVERAKNFVDVINKTIVEGMGGRVSPEFSDRVSSLQDSVREVESLVWEIYTYINNDFGGVVTSLLDFLAKDGSKIGALVDSIYTFHTKVHQYLPPIRSFFAQNKINLTPHIDRITSVCNEMVERLGRGDFAGVKELLPKLKEGIKSLHTLLQSLAKQMQLGAFPKWLEYLQAELRNIEEKAKMLLEQPSPTEPSPKRSIFSVAPVAAPLSLPESIKKAKWSSFPDPWKRTRGGGGRSGWRWSLNQPKPVVNILEWWGRLTLPERRRLERYLFDYWVAIDKDEKAEALKRLIEVAKEMGIPVK